MSRRDEHDVRHQPASPDDLAAHPPANETCARVRGLLRDYVDGELREREANHVEDHVHECRTCALALARGESEHLQIESAFAGVEVPEPPATLTTDIMQSVLDEQSAPLPTGFTRRVMERVAEDIEGDIEGDFDGARAGSAAAPLRWRRLALTALSVAATVLLAVVLGRTLFDVAAQPGLAVVEAEAARFVRGGDQTELHPDDLFPDSVRRASDRFVTGRNGVLELALDPSTRVRAGAESSLRVDVVAADGDASAQAIDLENGEFSVQADKELAMRFADGSRITLERGRYEVFVEPVRHQDQREGVRVEVRIEDEGKATIMRGASRTVVTRGQLGRYSTFSTLYVDMLRGEDLLNASRRRGDRRDTGSRRRTQPLEPAFGVILDPRTNTPVVDCTVTVRHYLGTETVQTDAAGEFRLGSLNELDGQFLMIRAVPPATHVYRGLAALDFTPLRVDARREVTERFYLVRGGVLAGRLLDTQGRAVKNTWVQLCRVDEALGVAQPINAAVRIEDSGRFELRGVPIEARPNQSLILLAQAPERTPELVWSGTHVRAEDSALALTLELRARKRMTGLPAQTPMQLLLPMQGVPLTSGFAVRTVQADHAGQVVTDLPREFFVLTGLGAPRAARIGAGGKLSFDRRPVPAVLRVLRAGDLPPQGVHWFPAAREFEVAFVPSGRGGNVSVQDGTTGQVVPGTRIYRRAADGVLWFHGVFDGREALRCPEDAVGVLLGHSPDGLVGHLDLGDGLRKTRRSMAVFRPARVEWAGVPSELVELRFGAGDHVLPVLRRGVEATWFVRPGSYRFRGRPLELEPGSTTSLR